MSLLNRLFGRDIKKQNSAQLAKERLLIVVTHQGTKGNSAQYLPKLKEELVNVIRKYVMIRDDQVQVSLANRGTSSVLELNITLPELEEV